jgi:sugar lactone lactonase YvrE
MSRFIVAILVVLAAAWWLAAAPRPEIQIAGSIVIDRDTETAIRAVDRSAEFAAALEEFSSTVPAFDDVVFLPDATTALVTATDGRIWRMNLANHAAEPLVDPPLMAYGIHEAPDNPNYVYFCASRSYAAAAPEERVGLYRLSLDTRNVAPLVQDVPATNLTNERPIVYADDDPNAPELRPGAVSATRPLIVCDNLDVSEDGKRIYFSEPFDYSGASVDDALDEAIALAPNGRLWRHDLDTGATRLIAEGFHFINGVLHDLHPGQAREQSVLVTQTSLFRLTRFYVAGPKAGSDEVVLDGITGLNDGMDRDGAGRIWLALFSHRSGLLTWAHEHAWIKPFLMRVPARLLLALPQKTGVLVVSPDGRTPLYSALYDGDALASIASAVPSPTGVYLANETLGPESRAPDTVVRLKWPLALQTRSARTK